MGKVFDFVKSVLENSAKIRYYSNMVIHVIDMLDGVQDWQKQNKPVDDKSKVKK